MPEIGATLREARMRARIDISEIEAETKIRAKYLRALENEEWDLLPGSTFVKSFLRTYAEALGIDAKLLVEEYKLRHEGLSGDELARPIGPPRPGRTRAGPGIRAGAIPRAYVVAGIVLALFGVLYVLGTLAGDSNSNKNKNAKTSSSQTTATTPATSTGATTPVTPAPPPPKLIKLQLVATGPVNVCLKAKGQPKALVKDVTLAAGEKTATFRSSRFRLVLGNNSVTLNVDGKGQSVAASSGPIGVQLTAKGASKLPKASWPSCL